MATIEKAPAFEAPGQPGTPVELRERYEKFIGGAWVAPSAGSYRDNLTPVTGEPFSSVADSTAEDIELALDAAHPAKRGCWGPSPEPPSSSTATCTGIGGNRIFKSTWSPARL
jgi:aldehyde dehydrogenase